MVPEFCHSKVPTYFRTGPFEPSAIGHLPFAIGPVSLFPLPPVRLRYGSGTPKNPKIRGKHGLGTTGTPPHPPLRTKISYVFNFAPCRYARYASGTALVRPKNSKNLGKHGLGTTGTPPQPPLRTTLFSRTRRGVSNTPVRIAAVDRGSLSSISAVIRAHP